MMVGIGDEPSIGDYERLLMATKTTARKELVLLHPSRSVTPGTTRKWLKVSYLTLSGRGLTILQERSWVHAHFHVELPVCMTSFFIPSLIKLQQGIEAQKPVAPILEDPAALVAFKKVKDVLQSELEKYRRSSKTLPQPRRPAHMTDFARLARHLCGRSIGLVLGGGGARGLSHVVRPTVISRRFSLMIACRE
jgi:lysophospholipid hydrolase